MNSKDFKAEIAKAMPGYTWTVHRHDSAVTLVATGTQSSGSNRLSKIQIWRSETDGEVTYTALLAGYGRLAPWIHKHSDGTLLRALRGLQDHLEMMATQYKSHAMSMQAGAMSMQAGRNPNLKKGGAA